MTALDQLVINYGQQSNYITFLYFMLPISWEQWPDCDMIIDYWSQKLVIKMLLAWLTRFTGGGKESEQEVVSSHSLFTHTILNQATVFINVNPSVLAAAFQLSLRSVCLLPVSFPLTGKDKHCGEIGSRLPLSNQPQLVSDAGRTSLPARFPSTPSQHLFISIHIDHGYLVLFSVPVWIVSKMWSNMIV